MKQITTDVGSQFLDKVDEGDVTVVMMTLDMWVGSHQGV